MVHVGHEETGSLTTTSSIKKKKNVLIDSTIEYSLSMSDEDFFSEDSYEFEFEDDDDDVENDVQETTEQGDLDDEFISVRMFPSSL